MASRAEALGADLAVVAREARDHSATRLATYVERLEALVRIDTGVDHPAGIDEAAGLLAAWAEQAGGTVERLAHDAGLHVHATFDGGLPGRVVLLGHHDTVFPRGTAARFPFAVCDSRAEGLGTADMKGGLLVALAAAEALAASGRPFPMVVLHSVPDEEVRTVPFATIDRLSGADAAFVFGCGRENGDFVAGRKTGAWVRLSARGRAAHAGTEPARGRSAVTALCREVLRCAALHDARPGLTVNVGTLQGGTIPNVVPAEAEARFDVRAARSDDLDWALDRMAGFEEHGGVDLELVDEGRWPGIEPTPAGERLAAAAVQFAGELDLDIGCQTTGGMSDGCWTAAAGVPTLDGLGPVGGYDHSPDEYIDLGSVAARCGIAAALAAAVGAGLLGEPGSRGR